MKVVKILLVCILSFNTSLLVLINVFSFSFSSSGDLIYSRQEVIGDSLNTFKFDHNKGNLLTLNRNFYLSNLAYGSLNENFNLSTTFVYYGWIPHFDFERGFNSYKNRQFIQEVHLALFSIDSSGEIVKSKNFSYALSGLNKYQKKFGINLHSSSTGGLQIFLKKGVDYLIKLIQDIKLEYQYLSSINLNFERIDVDESILWDYLDNLYFQLKSMNLRLFITVFAPGIKPIKSKKLTLDVVNQFNKFYHRTDYLVLMFYDFSLNNYSDKPSNSPYYWLESFLANNKGHLMTEKTIIGLPLYGYEFDSNNTSINAYVYSDILKLSYKYKIEYDQQADEYYMINYNSNSKIIFLNSSSLSNRIRLSSNYGINKFFFWRLGGDDNILLEIPN